MTFEEQQERLAHARRARAEALTALVASAASAAWRLAIRLRRSWIGAHGRAALYALSDRTLKDIGVHRSQIDSMFR